MFSFNTFINHFIHKENIDDGKLRSRVIYNTRYNLIILVSYSSKDFESVIEFLSAVNKTPVISILSHSAREKELSEEEMRDYDKKTVTIIDNRYYMLLSGTPEAYGMIMNHIDLDNSVLKLLIEDFYHCCSSTYFKNHIDYGVLELNKFIYKNVVPTNYNKLIDIGGNGTAQYYHDDLLLILNSLPESFLAIDLAKCINIYEKYGTEPIKRLYYDLNTLVYKASEGNETPYDKFIIKNMSTVFKLLVPEPCIETLSILNAPLYLRENLEDLYSGNKSIEELDELFQQDYDRFTQITAGESEYTDIDEQIGDNEETENMRKEDILD